MSVFNQMIDKEKAIMAVGDEGVGLYEKAVSQLEKFEGDSISGRIGGKLSIIYRIKGKGTVYINIYKDRVDMQLRNKSYENISYDKCVAELENFLSSAIQNSG